MTNGELIDILEKYDKDCPVVFRDYRGYIQYTNVDYVEFEFDDDGTKLNEGKYCVTLN